MEILFINLPGIVCLFVIIRGTTPLQNKEWLLGLFAPIISILLLSISYIVRFIIGFSYWENLEPWLNLFINLDEGLVTIFDDVKILSHSGLYSISLFLAIIPGLVLRTVFKQYHSKLLNNPSGFDIYDATSEGLYLIETKSKKVYVGKVSCGPTTGNKPDAFVTIIPVMSGFRNDLNVVVYQNFYQEKEYTGSSSLSNLEIHVSLNHISSIREFNWDTFKYFVERGTTIVSHTVKPIR